MCSKTLKSKRNNIKKWLKDISNSSPNTEQFKQKKYSNKKTKK